MVLINEEQLANNESNINFCELNFFVFVNPSEAYGIILLLRKG